MNWIVSFNDGQRLAASTIYSKDSKKNPWDGVMDYLKDNKSVEITHIQLDVNGVRYNTPTSRGNSPFGGSCALSGFRVIYREIGLIKSGGGGFPFIGFTYKIGDYRTNFWVNIKDNSTYLQVVNLKNPVSDWEKKQVSFDLGIEKDYEKIRNIEIDTIPPGGYK